MRTSWIGCGVLLCALATSGSAFAASIDAVRLGPNDEVVPIVAPGDQIGISCDALQVAQQSSDVRVVLTVSAIPGDSMPAYQKVLATDQQLNKGSLQVTVPNTPEIGNHTYDLTIYVMDKKGSQTCDAGHVKVAQSVVVPKNPG